MGENHDVPAPPCPVRSPCPVLASPFVDKVWSPKRPTPRVNQDAPELERFFRQHFPVVRGKCARMLGDTEEAADVAQETFVRLWQSPVAREAPGARLRWIYQTSTRLAIDRLRRRRLGIEVHADGGADAPGAEAGVDAVLGARQWLLRLAGEVPEDELEVAILSRLDDLTQDEIAEVTGRSSRTVRRMLLRVDLKLAEFLRRHA